MSKPTKINLKKAEQKAVLKEWKMCKNARKIAEKLNLPRHHVMFFCEQNNLCTFSESSYR